MAYIKNPLWVDGFGHTLISAEALNHLEEGVYNASVGLQTVNPQTGTTYTPVSTDVGSLIAITSAAAITVYLPQDSDADIPIGASIEWVPLGTGMMTFVAGTGATVLTADTAVTRKTNSVALSEKIAANTWLVVGDLAA